MKTYQFTITLYGSGNTKEEAWESVCEDSFKWLRKVPDDSETKLIEEIEE